jgi:hypothetical protein
MPIFSSSVIAPTRSAARSFAGFAAPNRGHRAVAAAALGAASATKAPSTAATTSTNDTRGRWR